MRHRQKIAIARLISDLIKSDALICPEEIAAYNKIVKVFDIKDAELCEAQYLSLADALHVIKQMSSEDRERFFHSFYDAAYSDNTCLSQEALLLLTISNIIKDDDDKYQLFSSESSGYAMLDKYVIYIESDYMPVINDEIIRDYDAIANLLQLWNFEFIYIPRLSQSFREMDKKYLYDILRYMNPRMSSEMIESLYQRLATFTTESYTRDYVVHTYQKEYFYDVSPSLLVTVGTSMLPPKEHSQQDRRWVNLLAIRLDDEPNSVLNEVRRLIDQYEEYITEPEFHRPQRAKGRFRYHGLYKQLFDFLARHRTNGEDNSILIDVPTHRIWMRGEAIQLSSMQLATYMLILHQSFCTHHGGLVKVGQHHPLSNSEIQRLTKAFQTIFNLFRDVPVAQDHGYLEEVNNIRSYIARIRTIISNHIDSEDVSYYLPKDSLHKDMYHISLDPSRIRVRDSLVEYDFCQYPIWKKL